MPSLPPAIVRPLLAAAVVLASLVAATQWTAALLAYHPALGAPWLDLLGLKLYAPWKVFSWWLAFGAQAPGVFARTGTLAALGGVVAGLIASGGAARRAGHGTPSTTYGSARWARSADVREAGLFCRQGHRARGPRRPLPAPRRPRARAGRGSHPLRQGRRPGGAHPDDLAGLRRHPRHQGRELAAHRRLALAVLALPAARPHQPALRPLQPAPGGAQGLPRGARCAQHRRHPDRPGRGARPGATTGRRARTPCSPAPSCTCSTPRRRRRWPASPPSSPIPPAPSAAPCG